MVKKSKSAKKKKMEIIPETSLSSEQNCGRSRLTKLRQHKKPISICRHKATSKRDKSADKGKGVAVEFQPEFDSDLEVNMTAKSMEKQSKLEFKKLQKGTKRLAPLKSPRKRCVKDCSSSEDDFKKPKKGRKAHEHTDGHNIKRWDMLLRDVQFFGGKVDTYNSESTIDQIKHTLTENQFRLLKASCFGKVPELKDFKFQTQIVHNILFREVSQSQEDELWVDMNGKIMRFGLDEFSVITGLKCVGSINMSHVEPISGGLFDRYFAPFSPLTT